MRFRWLGLVTVVLATGLSAQTSERLRLVTADLLENRREDGKEIQILSGNVVFQKGTMTLSTEQARFFKGTGETHLERAVTMKRPGELLTCDNMIFHNERDLIIATGSVRLEQENQVITSREIHFWTELDSAVAIDDVVMTQSGRQLTSEEFRSVQGDGPRGASFWAKGSVLIDEETRRVSSDNMRYIDQAERLDLLGNASIVQSGQLLKGDDIKIFYSGEDLRQALVKRNAEATSDIDALMTPGGNDWRRFTDLLTGRQIEAVFEEGLLSALHIGGMATSLYHVIEDSILQGINHASGDTMTLGFDLQSGDLNRLHVRGGARGRFEPEEANSDVDSIVVYVGESIDYDIPAEVTHIAENARVDYQDSGLAAGDILVTWSDNLMRAEPGLGEQPTLYQAGQDPMVGELMEFDLVAARGRVLKGKTHLDDGYYHGELIHRHPNDIFYVKNSIYTTCSLANPHFYFASNKMKMIRGDKVIARPVVLYIMDVPVLGLPFAVFPNESGGRRSGWIMPSYGNTNNSGQQLQGLGYFWAINEYMDSKTIVDFYTKSGIRATNRYRYNLRGKFSGNFGLRLYRELLGNDIAKLFTKDESALKWTGSWNHSQSIDPTQRLSVSGTYTSDPNLNRRFGRTQEERLNQQILSSASYAKRWRESGRSLNVAARDRYDLQAADKRIFAPDRVGQRIVERTQTLPSLSFSQSKRRLGGAGNAENAEWYKNIYWSLSSRLNNNQTVYWEADSTDIDTLAWSESRQVERKSSVRNSVSILNNGKVMRYLSLSVNVGVAEDWAPSHRKAQYDSTGAFLYENNSIVYEEVEEFSPRHTGSLGLTAQTNLYGLFPVNIGNFTSIRHTISPSINYTYAPDFSKPFGGFDLGYFDEDINGTLFDRFSGSTIGGTSSSERQSISFSLTNLFQGKREVDGKDEKIDLLRWGLSGGYNFAAEQFPISIMRSSFRSPFLTKLKLDVSMEHDFYAWDKDLQTRVNKTLRVPRLSRMSAGTNLRLSGKHLIPRREGVATAVDSAAADSLDSQFDDSGNQIRSLANQLAGATNTGNLWESTFRFRYSLRPSLNEDIAEIFSLSTNLKLSLGDGWRIGYQGHFNMLDQELVSHNLQFYRELHCWEFIFNWTPGGRGQGYFLSINVIDKDLDDIKYESKGGIQSIFGKN